MIFTTLKIRIKLALIFVYSKLHNIVKNDISSQQNDSNIVKLNQVQNSEELFSSRVHYGTIITLVIIMMIIPITIKDLPTAIFTYIMIGVASGLIYKVIYEKKLGFKKIESSKKYFEEFTYEKISIRYDVLNDGIRE